MESDGTITTKGPVTIPKAVRDDLALNSERRVIEDVHEAGCIALRGDVAVAVGVGRGEEEEGRAGDEVAAVLVEGGDLLAEGGLARPADDLGGRQWS